MMSRLVLSAVLVWGFAAWLATPVRAEVSVEVSPSLLELWAEPGGKGTQDLTVANKGSDPFTAAVAVKPVQSAAEAISAVDWLTVEPASFELEPGERRTVAVTIAVPSGVESGGRYALVTITAGAADQAEGANRASIAGELVVGFLIVVEGTGELVSRATIERFAAVLEEDGRVGFRVLLRNDGNVHLDDLSGTVDVAQADGERLGTLDFGGTTPIIPGTSRLLASQGSLPLPLGSSYTSAATIGYEEDEGKTADATVDFTVQPKLTLTEASVCENLDRGPTLRVGLRNDGDLGLLPKLQFAVNDASGNPLKTAGVRNPPLVWPNETMSLQADFPERLETGDYVLVVVAEYGTGQPVALERPFRIGGRDGAAPLCPAEPAPKTESPSG